MYRIETIQIRARALGLRLDSDPMRVNLSAPRRGTSRFKIRAQTRTHSMILGSWPSKRRLTVIICFPPEFDTGRSVWPRAAVLRGWRWTAPLRSPAQTLGRGPRAVFRPLHPYRVTRGGRRGRNIVPARAPVTIDNKSFSQLAESVKARVLASQCVPSTCRMSPR